jgi:hypothetical protein
MIMTDERVQKLTNYLSNDPDRMLKLFDMEPEKAVAQINADGYDFTVDELKEFAEAMVMVSEKTEGELDVDVLENVSGGVLTVGTVSCVCAIVRVCGPYAWKAGQWIGKKIVGR